MGDDGGGKWEGEVRSTVASLLLYSAKDCKSIGSEIRKLRFKDKGLKLKIVTARLVPESEKQLAPGAAVFQNCLL